MWRNVEIPAVQARRDRVQGRIPGRARVEVARPGAAVFNGFRMTPRIVLAWALALLLGVAATNASGEPYEDSPDASVSDADYAAGKSALSKENWTEAVRHFHQALLRLPDSADLHNYLGFSYRKLQKLDLAFQHYKRSLEANPRHLGAHEYIGEAYLMVGDLTNAEKHLAALRSICLLPCEELADLDSAITAHRAGLKQAAKP